MNRRIPLAPSEGWITLGLVVVMGLSLAWAIDDARWVLGRSENLDLLVLTAIGGVLAGFIGPKVGWGRWQTYLIGSIFAALLVPLLVGMVARPNGASIHDLYVTTATSVVQAYIDLAILNLPFTSQYLHYIFVLGMLVWATCMFASYAVFGHHRPLNAVIVVGILLVGNMAFTLENELQYLVLFSIASLFLLIRSHVYDEQAEWLRRRIGDPSTISSVYLRGGTVFITVAVISSFFLTQTAASAPLAGAWDGVEDGLLTLSRSVSRFLPTGGSTRPVGLSFGSNTQVQQSWNFDPGVAMTIQRDPKDTTEYYWRAYTYDRIDLKGWALTKACRDRRRRGPADPGRARRQPRHDGTAQLLVHGQPGEVPPAHDHLAGHAGERQRERQADDRRDLGLLRDARAQRRPGRVQDHRDGRGPRQRPRSAQRVGPRGDIDDVSGRHQGAVPDAAPGAHARDGRSPARGQDPGRGQVRRAV